MGRYHARIATAHIVEGEGPAARDDAVPRVVFTEPQVAAVGLTEAQARERGHDVRLTSADVGSTDGAVVAGEGVGGRAQLVIDRGRDVVLGATFIAPEAVHMMQAATHAIVGEASVTTLRHHAVPPFPTIHDVWLELSAAE
jgi:dihydrolipoamide dehydrogenase